MKSIDQITDICLFRENVSPRTRRKLIACPLGCTHGKVSYTIRIGAKYFVCCCDECETKWYVCLNCFRQRSHYFKFSSLKRHMTNCNPSIHCATAYASSSPLSSSITYFEFMKFKHFSRKETKEFYFHNQYDHGPSYLVGLSQYHLPNISMFLKSDEVTTQIRIADLLLGLHPSQVNCLLKVLLHFKKKITKEQPIEKWRCELPTTNNLVRKLYKNGKFAIHHNLPHPLMQTIDGHSYVSLKEIVQDSLANGYDFEPIFSDPLSDEVSNLNQSLFCKKLREKYPPQLNTVDILLTTWSDDFEPYNVKQNRGNSVWAFTCTLHVKSNNKPSSDSTYVISLGKKR